MCYLTLPSGQTPPFPSIYHEAQGVYIRIVVPLFDKAAALPFAFSSCLCRASVLQTVPDPMNQKEVHWFAPECLLCSEGESFLCFD